MSPQQSDAGGVGQAPPHASAWGPGERQVPGCDTEHRALKAAVVGALGSERGVMPHRPGPADDRSNAKSPEPPELTMKAISAGFCPEIRAPWGERAAAPINLKGRRPGLRHSHVTSLKGSLRGGAFHMQTCLPGTARGPLLQEERASTARASFWLEGASAVGLGVSAVRTAGSTPP